MKYIAELHHTKGRRQYGLCIVEGLRAYTTFIEAGLIPEELYITQEALGRYHNIPLAAESTIIGERAMGRISASTTPSGILGVFRIPEEDPDPIEEGIVLAQVQDPGNMGTLIRTSMAVGLPTIVCIEGSDPWAPKVIQASAGTIATARILTISWQELLRRKQDTKLCALVVTDGTSPRKLIGEKSLLVIGNEAHGIPTEWERQCDMLITLPMPGGTESLNAAVAGSLALYLAHIPLT